MQRKLLYAVISLAIVLSAAVFLPALPVFGTHSAEPAAAPTPEPQPEQTVLTACLRQEGIPAFRTDAHIAYMSADSQGNFHPRAGVSRAEAFGILYSLLEEPVLGFCPYADVEQDDACRAAAACLTAWGVLDASEPYLRPEEPLTGLELAHMLAAFGAEPTPAVTLCQAPVTRAELCVVLNRALGRSCDEAALLLSGVAPWADVSPAEPFFGDVMEASVPHEPTYDINSAERWPTDALEPGLHPLYGRLYLVSEDGAIARNMTNGMFSFGPDGACTTGDETLDGLLERALLRCVGPDMTAKQALQAAYLYVKENYNYLYLGELAEGFDTTGWEFDRGLAFFQNGGGTCYGFAAAFGLLARQLGYEAYIISGQVNEYYYPHSWVVIPENGTNYIYDVELEYARPSRHADLSLFRIKNFSVYSYWYDPWW